MPSIQIQIKKCSECPNCKITKLFTEDSWEHAYDYWCKAVADDPLVKPGREQLPFKLIKGYVEWESEVPEPPVWCPCISRI